MDVQGFNYLNNGDMDAFHRLAEVLVQSGHEAGEIKLIAHFAGLADGMATIRTRDKRE